MGILSALFNVQIGICVHALYVNPNASLPKAMTTQAVHMNEGLITPINTPCTSEPTSVHQVFGPSRKMHTECLYREKTSLNRTARFYQALIFACSKYSN